MDLLDVGQRKKAKGTVLTEGVIREFTEDAIRVVGVYFLAHVTARDGLCSVPCCHQTIGTEAVATMAVLVTTPTKKALSPV